MSVWFMLSVILMFSWSLTNLSHLLRDYYIMLEFVCVYVCVCIIWKWTWCTEAFMLWRAVVLIRESLSLFVHRWSLNGIEMAVINSVENQWRNWYFKLLAGNKQVFLRSSSHVGATTEKKKKKEKWHRFSLLSETVLHSKSTREQICGSLMERKY